jgi:uncharacterized protein YgiM (DUF1202 family)
MSNVSAPDATLDPPRFGRLTLIVTACFALGVAWPSIAGMKFVQRPPGSAVVKPDEIESPDAELAPGSTSDPDAPELVPEAAGAEPGLIRSEPAPLEANAPSQLVDASGQATISAKEALVREGPSRQAKIAAHLRYGTRINVTGRMGEWYRVKYPGGNSVGWVHRKAIGM